MGFQPIAYRYGQVPTITYPEQSLNKHTRHHATPIIRQYYIANPRPVNVYQNSNNNNNQKLLPPSPPPPPIFTPTPTHHHRSKRCIQLKSKALLIVSAFLLTVIILQIAIMGLIINYHYVQNANSGSSLTMRAKVTQKDPKLL
ncbi:unnamed protein product [Hymenolepis diminuta]|uniref:Wsv008 n=1 Tax=Hymenolepis diminuta TaxID=6216 RepID=A0A0R3SYK4_HYMDI|nr:unnamed protein product [Hymenolepis diminuta]